MGRDGRLAVGSLDGLDDALKELPMAEQELLRLSFWEGFKQTEIAQRLGVSQPTISRRLRTVLAKLRQALGPHQEGEFE